MIIEFADPGIDWTPLWWSLAVLVGGISLFFLPFMLPKRYFSDWMPGPGAIITLVGICFTLAALLSQPLDHSRVAVPNATVKALEEAGYESVTLTGDRFTANDDGEFFSGVLVDLDPETGHAYRVFELKEEQ